jgi:hypothetical protein
MQILKNPDSREGYAEGVALAVKSALNVITSVFLQEGHGAPERRLFEPKNDTERALMGLGETFFIVGGAIRMGGASAAPQYTRVGRWMSVDEYKMMLSTGRVQEGAGGVTFAATSGPDSFGAQAAAGTIYIEYDVPTNSLLTGGRSDWVKNVGPSANRSQKVMLEKKGGEMLPEVKNVSPPLKKK